MRGLLPRLRPWLALAGLVLIVVALAPPVSGDATRYAWAGALQFEIFAAAAPALLVLGVPERWRHRADLIAARLPGGGWPPARRGGSRLLAFMTLAVAWRLPGSLGAMVRWPALTLAEMVTLAGAGALVWLEIAAPMSWPWSLIRPQRAGLAAVSMWTNWILGYVTGMFTTSSLLSAYVQAAGGLSAADDRQVAAALMWAVPALCYVPVVFVMLLAWIRDSERPEQDPRAAALTGAGQPGVPRGPRGWRAPVA